MLPKRFQHRKNYPAPVGVHRNSFNIVKSSVFVGVKLLVQLIEIHHFQKNTPVEPSFRKIVDKGAGGVVLIYNIQHKFIGSELIGIQIIDVFHHQIPRWQIWRKIGPFKQFQHQSLGRLNPVGGELSNLEYFPG